MNILLTGATGVIGKELVNNFKNDNFNFLICSRSWTKLKKLKKINKNIKVFKCDVSKEEQVKKFKKYSLKYFKKIDIIINAAGTYGSIGRFDKIDFLKWKKAMEINFFGTVLICKYFMDQLLRSKIKKIINFSGGGAFNAFPNYSAYACSKAALVRFTENIAVEFKKQGVVANCVAPGFNKSAMHLDTLKAGPSKAGKNFYSYTKKKLKMLKDDSVLTPIKCIKFLINNKIKKISGRTISANFDSWNSTNFENMINKKENFDLFYMRRINLK